MFLLLYHKLMLGFILPSKQVRTGSRVSNEEILGFAKLFNDELTLDNISRSSSLLSHQYFWKYLVLSFQTALDLTKHCFGCYMQASFSKHVQVYGYQPIWNRCISTLYASEKTARVRYLLLIIFGISRNSVLLHLHKWRLMVWPVKNVGFFPY
jgi:hypothetical protein